MKKIAFLISDRSIYSAGIKPFVDIGHGLYKLGIAPSFYALNIKKGISSNLSNMYPHLNFINVNTIDEIIKNIETSSVELIISDDFLPRLNILHEIKRETGIKTASYALIFYGLNTLNKSSKKSLKYWLGSMVPWSMLTNKYCNTLRSMDFVIGSSYATSYVLNLFYSVYTSGVVYPPVGVNFEKIEKPKISKKEGLLVYLGHYPDYYLRDMPYTINQLSKRISKIKIWTGNPENLNGLKPNVEVYTDISDKEVMDLYQSSEAVYIPTAFEGFGYVGPEALLFDTPVLLDTYQPWLEGFPMDSNAVKILDPKDESIEPFLEFLKSSKDVSTARQYIERRYSAIQSAKDLLYIINKNRINGGFHYG